MRVEPYGGVYARAWVDSGQGPERGLTRMYFRMVDGRWVQSEPTSDEVGAEKKTTIDGIDIDYWEIDADVVEAMRQGTQAARDAVVRNQLGASKQPNPGRSRRISVVLWTLATLARPENAVFLAVAVVMMGREDAENRISGTVRIAAYSLPVILLYII